MHNEEVLNGIAAIIAANKAYQELYPDVTDDAVFAETVVHILESMCTQNTSLLNADSIRNSKAPFSDELGTCEAEIQTEIFLPVLQRHIPNLIQQRSIHVPVGIDVSNRFVMVLEVEEQTEAASVMAQYMLLASLKNNSNLHFYCADMVKGGTFFSASHGLIAKYQDRTGGKVFKTDLELTKMLEELDKYATKALSSLESPSETVSEHNRSNLKKLPEFVQILYLSDAECHLSPVKSLRKLVENREKNGMSFIIVGDRKVTAQFSDLADVYLRYGQDGTYIGEKAQLAFTLSPEIKICNDDFHSLEKAIQKSTIVNTNYAQRPELHTEPQTLYAERMIRVPFAVDKDGCLLYFEIGGEAPPHALISGTTGSGKSVGITYIDHADDSQLSSV